MEDNSRGRIQENNSEISCSIGMLYPLATHNLERGGSISKTYTKSSFLVFLNVNLCCSFKEEIVKYLIENMGPIRYAEYSLDSFNVVCGMNNTGKTYITYCLFGFLSGWEEIFESMLHHPEVEKTPIDLSDLIKSEESKIDLNLYWGEFSDGVSILQDLVNNLCDLYSENLGAIFAAEESKFTNSSLSIKLDETDVKKILDSEWSFTVGIPTSLNNKNSGIQYMPVLVEKRKSDFGIYFNFGDISGAGLSILSNYEKKLIDAFNRSMSYMIVRHVLRVLFPRPYISSAERTGIVTFSGDLAFARQKLVKSIVSKAKNGGDGRREAIFESIFMDDELVDPKYDFEYASGVQANIDFMTKMAAVVKKNSYIHQEHENILQYFLNISEGEYKYSGSSIGYFLSRWPSKKFGIDEVSSSVRALADLWFYLRYYAQEGDLLIIDEPELNLHPKNQRFMARLLAMISRSGINVLITTHSEYILRELNYLIHLHSVWGKVEHDNDLVVEYDQSMFLNYKEVNVCVTGINSVLVPGNKRKTKVNTLSKVEANEHGIEMDSFNDVIDEMNKLEDYIYWGLE